MTEKTQSFASFEEWVRHAHRWLTAHLEYNPNYYRAVCFDSAGKICINGGDFKTATYPVYWVWPDQNLFTMVDSVERKQC